MFSFLQRDPDPSPPSPAPSSSPDTSGLTQLDESEVVIHWASEKGSGGFASVYTAQYAGSHAAVKVIKHDSKKDPVEHRRIVEREFSLVASLRHPRIASVHGFVELTQGDTRGYGIVMQLASTTLKTPSKFNATTLNYAIQIAHGVKFLHGNNILHLDLKPQNVLVFPGNEGIKLTDFGCSRFADEPTPPFPEVLPWSSVYAPPEMIPNYKDPQTYSTASDCYSFGVMIYELFCNQKAFADVSMMDMKDEKTSKPFVFHSDVPMSSKLSRLIQDLLSVNPRDRPSMYDALTTLESLESSAPPGPEVPEVFAQTSSAPNTSCFTSVPLIVYGRGQHTNQQAQVLALLENYQCLPNTFEWISPIPFPIFQVRFTSAASAEKFVNDNLALPKGFHIGASFTKPAANAPPPPKPNSGPKPKAKPKPPAEQSKANPKKAPPKPKAKKQKLTRSQIVEDIGYDSNVLNALVSKYGNFDRAIDSLIAGST
ncbi:hypothetical protein GEMRC1_007744 [Eukaryota sp. GEM-RC1]